MEAKILSNLALDPPLRNRALRPNRAFRPRPIIVPLSQLRAKIHEIESCYQVSLGIVECYGVFGFVCVCVKLYE